MPRCLKFGIKLRTRISLKYLYNLEGHREAAYLLGVKHDHAADGLAGLHVGDPSVISDRFSFTEIQSSSCSRPHVELDHP